MKILVVDDHALVREGLAQVLQGLSNTQASETIEVLQAPNCTRAFMLAQAHPDLDLVLLDYHLPDMDGLAALTLLGKNHPELPVVLLSGSANPSVMQRALDGGAAGFLTKSGLSDDLLSSLRRVLDGEVVIAKEFAAQFDPSHKRTSTAAPILTARQEDVLKLMQQGRSNREIGEELNLAEETIKSHVAIILRTLGVKTRLQAAMEAGRWGYGKPGALLP